MPTRAGGAVETGAGTGGELEMPFPWVQIGQSKSQSTPSPVKSSDSGGNSSKSGKEKSKASNTSSPAAAGSSKTTNNPSSSGSNRPDLTNKLGKDGKLTADERKQHLDNNLCMFCRGPSHFVDNCPKKTKKAKACAVATDTTKSGKMDSNSGANSESKKE